MLLCFLNVIFVTLHEARALIFMRVTALHYQSAFIFHTPKVRLIEKNIGAFTVGTLRNSLIFYNFSLRLTFFDD